MPENIPKQEMLKKRRNVIIMMALLAIFLLFVWPPGALIFLVATLIQTYRYRKMKGQMK